MVFSDYMNLDGTALAALVRDKAVKPEELLDLAVAAIEAVNPSLNMISVKLFDAAYKQAQVLDPDAPFAGVPMLLKDCGPMVAGVPYSAGSRLMKGSIAKQDTELTRRFRKAGFLFLGTTNTPECCFTNTTESVLHGATRNAWNTAYSTGGSSGGAASAVAARLVPVAHGTDGGGSIREPAACCGVVGFKPSRFAIPNAPEHGDFMSGTASSFALTRSIRDAARLMDAVSGPDEGCYGMMMKPPYSYEQAIHMPIQPMRIAVLTSYPLGGEINPECSRALGRAVKLLSELGHQLSEARLPIDSRIHWARGTIQSIHIVKQLDRASEEMNRPVSPQYVEERLYEVYQKARALTALEFITAMDINNTISRNIGRFMRDYDIILCPTMGELPPLIGELDPNLHTSWSHEEWSERKGRYTHFTNPFNATGQPSISIPLYESSTGLPIGIELSGRIGEDDKVLALAAQLEEALPWSSRYPDICCQQSKLKEKL